MPTAKRTVAAKVALNLSRLAVPEKVTLAEAIAKALTGNATFPSPPIAPATIQVQALALSAAEGNAKAARQAATVATTQRDDAVAMLEASLTNLGKYVEMIAKGDAATIGSAAMPLRGAAVRMTTAPAAPGNLVASSGTKTGEARLSWKKPAGAKSYVVERSVNPNDALSWVSAVATTKTRTTVPAQPSGRQWYRVAGIGAQGQGAWSDPATCLVP